jgi:hypothetical protein
MRKLRKLLIKRILSLIYPDEDYTISFRDGRWKPVAEYYAILNGTDYRSKRFRKELKTFQLTEEMLEELTDENLVNIFQCTVHRAYVCR